MLAFQPPLIAVELNRTDQVTFFHCKIFICIISIFRYNGVNIQDFHVSWRNGLGFNALIHSHRPDLINFPSLHNNSHIQNLNNAFDIAQKELGIPRLLDAEGKYFLYIYIY